MLLCVESDNDRWKWNADFLSGVVLLGKIDRKCIAVDCGYLHLIDGNDGIGTGEIAVDAVPPIAGVLLCCWRTWIDGVVARLAILSPSAWRVVFPEKIMANARLNHEWIVDYVERLHDAILGEPRFGMRPIGLAWLA